MEKLCVTFEEWHLGDGNYPPLHKGQKVNLSFYIYPGNKEINANEEYYFNPIADSNYMFSGKVIRNYVDNEKQIIIIDTGSFKFYLEEFDLNFRPLVGQFISGNGLLLLDYYIWVENLDDYPDAPNIFYNFEVSQILRISIPERFIHRHSDGGTSYPTSLSPGEYDNEHVQEIEDMADDTSGYRFYLLKLISIDEEFAKTFN